MASYDQSSSYYNHSCVVNKNNIILNQIKTALIKTICLWQLYTHVHNDTIQIQVIILYTCYISISDLPMS